MAHNPRPVRSYTVSLGARGRIVLPADLRAERKWKEGERLRLVEEDDGTLRLMTVDEALGRLRGMHAHLATPGVSVVDELIAERRAEAARE
jgi:AbrB family looped-hinge helix DNA binding protein